VSVCRPIGFLQTKSITRKSKGCEKSRDDEIIRCAIHCAINKPIGIVSEQS